MVASPVWPLQALYSSKGVMAPSPQQRRQFKIGKYDILAQPALGSMHMLRYTVMLNGKRLGAFLSMPTESDCKILARPPAAPPLKIFPGTYRPGRPEKNANNCEDN